MSAKVYFSREITPEKLLELYKMVGKELPGKVAVKLHSGEKGNQNFLKPEFLHQMTRLQLIRHVLIRYINVQIQASHISLSELKVAMVFIRLKRQQNLDMVQEHMNW